MIPIHVVWFKNKKQILNEIIENSSNQWERAEEYGERFWRARSKYRGLPVNVVYFDFLGEEEVAFVEVPLEFLKSN